LEEALVKRFFDRHAGIEALLEALKMCRILNVETSMSRSSQQKRKKFIVLGMIVLFSEVNSCLVKTASAVHRLNFERLNFERPNFERLNLEGLNLERLNFG
jgi:hypothetical protein